MSSALSPIELWLDRWELEPDGDAIERNGAHVAFVRRGDTRMVLKVLKPNSDEMLGPMMLAHYRGRSAVRVLGHEQNAVLLERALPGTELTEIVLAGRDDEAVRILCGVMADLHQDDPPPGRWPTVEDWGRAFARYRAGEPHPEIPADLLDRAEAEYRDLCASQGRRYLLHGDLHHENVLDGGDRGWLVIDPKGVIGELTYETGAGLRNPGDAEELYNDPRRIARRVRIIAETLGLPEQRILRWSFAQSVLSALWHVEDGDGDEAVAAAITTATAMHTLLAV
ncbi:aminoglycoside phosphotransferase family protein [Inquilinus sp. Marseille-Q2685]|uniref:aminoglycoside phosphotransferase family protein n=1 Tax=Inquilinus sp. Marseille-Q2685 TaxID=2866581 RepID=UPI001CE3CA02|nr:aminoglycoside phosphotransferase family protein [Inquilinus sp. Marseille-Q2685]